MERQQTLCSKNNDFRDEPQKGKDCENVLLTDAESKENENAAMKEEKQPKDGNGNGEKKELSYSYKTSKSST